MSLPLTWADKINSPSLADFIEKYGAEYCMTAEEINEMRDAVNEMAVIQQSTFQGDAEPGDTPAGTGNRYWTAVTPGTYTNFGGVVVGANSLAIISVIGAVFSVSQTSLDISGKVNVSDVKELSPLNADFILDEAWVNTGESASYAGMVRTEPFVVAGGEKYIYRGYGIASTINVLELDFDSNPIVLNTQEFGINDGNSHDVEITLNKNTRFVALTFLKAVFLTHGCSFLNNEKTSLTIANLQNELSTLSSDNSALKINLIGDSISLYGTLKGGWVRQLYSSLGVSFATLGNYAIGGNRLSIPFGGNDATIAGGGATAMCVRYAAMSDDADIILINGGTNDGMDRVGTVAELTATTPDKTTIVGAMRVLIEGIYAKYAGKKNIRLIWIINPRSFSYSNAIDHTGVVELDTTPREDVMKSVLKYYGIPYVDLYNESGISRLTARPNPNIVYGIAWPNSSSSLTGSGGFDTVAGYEASDYIASVYGDVFCSDNWCKVAFYNSSFAHIAGSTQFNDAHATVNYTAPVGTAYFRVSKPNSTVLYLTNAKGTYMCDPVHPTLNAQEIIFKMVLLKLSSLKNI